MIVFYWIGNVNRVIFTWGEELWTQSMLKSVSHLCLHNWLTNTVNSSSLQSHIHFDSQAADILRISSETGDKLIVDDASAMTVQQVLRWQNTVSDISTHNGDQNTWFEGKYFLKDLKSLRAHEFLPLHVHVNFSSFHFTKKQNLQKGLDQRPLC